jgi:hypothetical protein
MQNLLSAAGGEERLQKGTGFVGENPRSDFDLMVELWTGEEFEAGSKGATFGIVSSVNKSRDASLDDCSRAHSARL